MARGETETFAMVIDGVLEVGYVRGLFGTVEGHGETAVFAAGGGIFGDGRFGHGGGGGCIMSVNGVCDGAGFLHDDGIYDIKRKQGCGLCLRLMVSIFCKWTVRSID